MNPYTYIHFGQKVPRNGVPIAHISVDQITSDTSIVVIDKSSEIPQNSFYQQDTIIELNEDIRTYFVDKNGFIITDRFSSNLPLYFKHVLTSNIYVSADGTADIIIVDESNIQLSSEFYLFDCKNNTIYHAIEPTSKVYSVIYPTIDENGNISNQDNTELLSSIPVFEEADATDIASCGGLNPDSDSYTIEEQDGQPFIWRITLPRATKYSLRYTEDGLLKITIPKLSQSDPWYVNIQNSVLLTIHSTQDKLLRYGIPEFEIQNFYPFPPIKLAENVETSEISAGILYLGGYKNIISNLKTPIDIIIKNIDNRVIRAITTDVNKSGKIINGIYWEVNQNLNIDSANGRIRIGWPLKSGEKAIANFYYNSRDYRYTGYNFNPLYNPLALDQRVVILCRPDIAGCNSTISHVVLNRNEQIISASDSDISTWAVNKTLQNLISDWTYAPNKSENNQNNYLILGIVSVDIAVSPQFINIVDARRLGGGLIKDYYNEAFSLMPESKANLDVGYYNGPPVPLNGGILLLLPSQLGDIYTQDEIISKIKGNNFFAAGTGIVIRYYNTAQFVEANLVDVRNRSSSYINYSLIPRVTVLPSPSESLEGTMYIIDGLPDTLVVCLYDGSTYYWVVVATGDFA